MSAYQPTGAMTMQCKPEKQKLVKSNKPRSEADRVRLARKKKERQADLMQRQRNKAFELWSNYIREGVRPVERD